MVSEGESRRLDELIDWMSRPYLRAVTSDAQTRNRQALNSYVTSSRCSLTDEVPEQEIPWWYPSEKPIGLLNIDRGIRSRQRIALETELTIKVLELKASQERTSQTFSSSVCPELSWRYEPAVSDSGFSLRLQGTLIGEDSMNIPLIHDTTSCCD